ncbi:MAG TPA: class I SAM-dependent methyltransferase [Candidatus Binatus sp.]|nr:class I SAM-dependent methyltransferase [Candidatus Binatus sp.]
MITPQTAVVDVTAVAAHYDDLDEFYRGIWGSNLHHGYWISGKETTEEAVNNLVHLVARLASLATGDRVCDIGCGYGATALMLNRVYGATVTGLTVSPKQHRRAEAAAAGNLKVSFLLRDAVENRLNADSYDAVIAIESSEHIADKPRIFAEAQRILRQEGHCVIAAWLTCERPNRWQTRYLLEPICAEGRLPSMASVVEYRNMIENAGFRNIEFRDLTRDVKKTWTVCAARVITRLLADPAFRRRLLDREFTNRVFAKTIFRIRLAYEIGAMRYGIFSAQK